MKEPKQYLVVVIAFLVLAASANAQTSAEQFKQMVEQLQATPTDNALREKIIKLAAEMNPPLVVPDEAVRFEGRGQFAFKNAKSQSDYASSAQEYEKAVVVAPWVAGYYSDLCTIYEKAGKYSDAQRNCQFYMAALSDPKEITEVKRRIAGLEYGLENAAGVAAKKQKQAEDVANEEARAAAQQAAVYQGLDGGVWKIPGPGFGSAHVTGFMEIHGNRIKRYSFDDLNGRHDDWDSTFTSRHFSVNAYGEVTDVTISNDGQSITETYPGSPAVNNGRPWDQHFTYKRIK